MSLLFLLATAAIIPEMVLPPRTSPVPKVYWSCTLRTTEDLAITFSGETDAILASAQRPMDVQKDVRTSVRIFDDSSKRLDGTHSANYIDLAKTFRMSVDRDTGTYFLTLEFLPPSGRSYAVLSFKEPRSMGPDEPIAIGFCKHSPLDIDQ